MFYILDKWFTTMARLWKYIRVILQQDTPLKFIISRMLVRSGLCRFIKIKIRQNGYSLLLQPSSLSMTLWCNPSARNHDVDFINMILRPGDNFYDIGANIGQLSIAAAKRVGPQGLVTSFEAHPRIAAYFRNNIALNKLKNIRFIQSAVGEKCGLLMFTDISADDQNKVSENGSIYVPVLNLDTISEGEKIVLLKVDVEGYELFVLRGALKTLKYVDFIYFEAWDEHFSKYGYNYSDIHKLLEVSGFTIGKLDVDRKLISVVNKSDKMPNCINLLAWRDTELLVSRTGCILQSKP